MTHTCTMKNYYRKNTAVLYYKFIYVSKKAKLVKIVMTEVCDYLFVCFQVSAGAPLPREYIDEV